MKKWSTKILSVLLAIGMCMTNMVVMVPKAYAAGCPDSGTGSHVISNSTRQYVSNGSSGHSQVAQCQACGASVTVSTSSHSYSTSWNGCYYTRTCSDCGYSTSGVSHSWSSYSYTYTDSTTHTGIRRCSDCGATSSTTGSHSTTTRYGLYSDTQHKVEKYCATCSSVIDSSYSSHSFTYGNWTKLDNEQCSRTAVCSVCTYTGTEPQNHSDSNNDGQCDFCKADMNVVVTFQLYGGVFNEVTVRYGSMADKPEDPTRAGYDFVEWTGANGSTFNFAEPLYTATTIKAVWEARSDTAYTVNYYQQDIEGDGYSLVETRALAGTTDTRVYAEEESYEGFLLNEERSIMEGNVNGDNSLVLDVYYDRKLMMITIDLANKIENVEIRYGETLDVPETPTRPGYDFVSWTDGEDKEVDFSAPITGPVTLVATWTPRNDTPYTVKHYLQEVAGDGYTLTDTENLVGTTDTTATAAVRSFVGFHEATDHAGYLDSGNIAGDGSLELKIYYDRDPMKITIDLANKTEDVEIRYGGTLDVPEDPTRSGYDFVAWTDSEGHEFDFSTPVTGPVTLVATWIPRNDTPYMVEHYQQTVAGDYVLVDTENLMGTTDTIATAAVRSITGFHEAIDHEGHTTAGNIDGDGSRVLRVYYERDTVEIILDLDGATGNCNVIYGGTLPIPETPVRPGYDFITWLDANGDEYDFNTPVTESIELKAEWEPRDDTPYQVRHYQQNVTGEGYTLVDTENLIGTTDTTATAVVGSYTGFHENVDYAERLPSGNINGDGALVLSLYYDRDSVKVNFDAAGGTVQAPSKDVRYEAPYGELPVPARDGYDFGGWWIDEDHQVTAQEGNVTEEHTLFAKWTPRGDTPYTIAYYLQTVELDGYEQTEAITLFGVTGSTATAQAKSYPGFHSNEDHPDRLLSGLVKGDGSLTLALYYDRDSVTVSIDFGDGGLQTQEIPYGGTIAKPNDPTRPGYIFNGWKDENGNEYDFNTPVTGSLNLMPSWRIRPRPKPPQTEEADLLDGMAPLSEMPGLEDMLLTRAQAAYIFAVSYGASVEGLEVTTAFDDVRAETDHALYITWVNDAGVEVGYGTRQFGPADDLTREQLALMLYRVYGDGSQADLGTFADSDLISSWAYDAVCWAVSKGILSAEGDSLHPQDGVTGKEMAALLQKAMELVYQNGG